MQGKAYFPSGNAAGPTQSEPATGVDRMRYRAVAAGCIGNMLEWYDFAIYAFFATTIATQLFPAGDETAALLSTYLIFGISFVARPLGGLLIGLLGDRRGRKPALVLTITAMAAGTAMIGLIPPYAAIGIGAPAMLLCARLLQGLSAGGEWGGSLAFLVEWAPPGRRGLYGGFHETCAVAGPLLASAMAAATASLLPAAAAGNWGWRLPFLVGGLLGPVGLFLRRNIEETPAFREKAARPPAAKPKASRIVLLGAQIFMIVAVIYAAFYTLFYMSTFLVRYAGVSQAQALWSTTLATLALAVTVPIAAALSDTIGRKPLMLASCLLLAIVSYPLFAMMTKGISFGQILALHIIFGILTGIFSGPFPAAVAEQFPTELRLTVPSVAYSLGGILFGGFNSYITTWLIAWTGTPNAVSYIVVFAAILSGIGLLTIRETAHDPLLS